MSLHVCMCRAAHTVAYACIYVCTVYQVLPQLVLRCTVSCTKIHHNLCQVPLLLLKMVKATCRITRIVFQEKSRQKSGISPFDTFRQKSKEEVTTFLTFHYHFCFNVLTEVTEVACLENDVPDPHLHYAKVLQTRTRRGVFRLCFRFAMVEDDLQKVLTFSVTQLFGRMKSIHPSVIRSMTAYSLSRILPLLGGCILSKGMYIG